jgi:hypothetical protein
VDSLPKGYMLSKDDVSWIEVVHKVTEDTSWYEKIWDKVKYWIDKIKSIIKDPEKLPRIATIDPYEIWIDAWFLDTNLNALK